MEVYPARINSKVFPRYLKSFSSGFVHVDADHCYDLAKLQCEIPRKTW